MLNFPGMQLMYNLKKGTVCFVGSLLRASHCSGFKHSCKFFVSTSIKRWNLCIHILPNSIPTPYDCFDWDYGRNVATFNKRLCSFSWDICPGSPACHVSLNTLRLSCRITTCSQHGLQPPGPEARQVSEVEPP